MSRPREGQMKRKVQRNLFITVMSDALQPWRKQHTSEGFAETV
jgi:hypothetical protein